MLLPAHRRIRLSAGRLRWRRADDAAFVFSGSQLELNYSTSAVGSVRAELQESDGAPIPGFGLDLSPERYGDEIEGVLRWKGGDQLRSLAGRPVRLRLALQDTDVYAFRFA